MSAKVRIVIIEAEGDGASAALQQLAAFFPSPSAELIELPAARDVRPSVRPYNKRASQREGRPRAEDD